MKVYLYHNLGLGDHIICNALVRHFEKQYGLIHLFAKRRNAVSVKFMFRDIDVNVISVVDDLEVEEILQRNKKAKVIRIGCTGEDWNPQGSMTFDDVFYMQARLPLSERWDGFKYERPDSYFPVWPIDPVNPYKFVHDDHERGMKIRDEYLIGDTQIVRPIKDYTKNIFQWDRAIMGACEVHCINSSFLLLADSIPTKGKLFYHKYARDEGRFCNPHLRKKWEIIE